MNTTVKKRYTFLRWTLSVLTIFIAAILLIILLLQVLFYFNRDYIESELFRIVSDIQNGDLYIKDIHLSPFAHFPNMTLKLDSVIYYERHSEYRPPDAKPIAEINHLFFALDILELLQGKIDVSEITLEAGNLHLIRYPDNTLNYVRALGINDSASVTTSSDTTSSEIEIELDRINLKNVTLILDQQVIPMQVEIQIRELYSYFHYTPQFIDGRIDANMEIIEIITEEDAHLKNRILRIDSDIKYNKDKQMIEIAKGNLVFETIPFEITGTVDLTKRSELDLKLDASDRDMQLFGILIAEDILDANPDIFEKGDLYLNGNIKGEFANTIPDIRFTFGGGNIRINIPGKQDSIIVSGFSGSFISGTAKDFSQSVLTIKNLKVTLPDSGWIDGSLSISNLQKPHLDIDWNSRVDLSIFDRLFDIKVIENMSGLTTIKAISDKDITFEKGVILLELEKAEIVMQDVSVKFDSSFYRIDSLSGLFKKRDNALQLDSVNLKLNGYPVSINGEISNLINLILGWESEINANLALISPHLNPGIMFKTDSLTLPFTHQDVTDFSTQLTIVSTVSELSSLFPFPRGNVRIDHFTAKIPDWPDVNSLSGDISIIDQKEGITITAQKLNCSTSSGTVSINDFTWKPAIQSVNLSATVDVNEIYIDSVSTQEYKTSAPDTISNVRKFDADFHLSAELHYEPLRIDHLNISRANVDYQGPVAGRMVIENMECRIENALFTDTQDTTRLIPIESFSGEISASSIRSEISVEKEVRIKVDLADKKYHINYYTKSVKAAKENGNLEIDMSGEKPAYFLSYNIEDFPLHTLLTRFRQGELMSGNINMYVKLSTGGQSGQEIVRNLQGEVVTTGKELILYGIDLDELLKKYRRSQNFNLVDISAYLVAGPFGAVITKGADFARLADITSGQQSRIKEIISHWQIQDGIVVSRDVAFATASNRIALTGNIDIDKKYINDITVAVVDNEGCSLIKQSLSGPFDDIKLGDLDTVGTLLGAVINVFKLIALHDCKPFYTGSLKHPEN